MKIVLITSITLALVLDSFAQTPGTKLWELTTGGRVSSSPALGGDGTIYFGSDDGKLWAVSTNGTTNWTFRIGPQVTASPAIGTDGNEQLLRDIAARVDAVFVEGHRIRTDLCLMIHPP